MNEEKVHPRDTAQSMAVRLALVEERNLRVERDKAWETSWARRFFIMAITYGLALIFLILLEAPRPAFMALVPTVGFLLSTLSLPIVRRLWLKFCYKY